MSDILPHPDDVQIRELIAWPLDAYAYRDHAISLQQLATASERAAAALSPLNDFVSALDVHLTRNLRPLLSQHLSRPDLLHEYAGLRWTLGVVDLHQLLAFQRRLVLDQAHAHEPLPNPDDWPALLNLALNGSRSTACTHAIQQYTADRIELTVRSANPDLKLQPTTDSNLPFSLSLTGGTPFFEVAELENRWFSSRRIPSRVSSASGWFQIHRRCRAPRGLHLGARSGPTLVLSRGRLALRATTPPRRLPRRSPHTDLFPTATSKDTPNPH